MTNTAVYPLGLGEPDAEALAFPREILNGVESALILFASGRGGAADGRWLAEAGIQDVDFVDWDTETLNPMMQLVPRTWQAHALNILEHYDRIAPGKSWEHLSADPPSHLAPIIFGQLPEWLSRAAISATITLYRHCFIGEPSLDAPELVAPVGWVFTKLIKRSDFRGGIYWLVAERV